MVQTRSTVQPVHALQPSASGPQAPAVGHFGADFMPRPGEAAREQSADEMPLRDAMSVWPCKYHVVADNLVISVIQHLTHSL